MTTLIFSIRPTLICLAWLALVIGFLAPPILVMP